MEPKHVIVAAIEHTIPERGVKATFALGDVGVLDFFAFVMEVVGWFGSGLDWLGLRFGLVWVNYCLGWLVWFGVWVGWFLLQSISLVGFPKTTRVPSKKT